MEELLLDVDYNSHLYVQYTEWSVMLRKRWESNTDVRLPATCHQAIPSLSPARWQLGMTALNYRLIVCGGLRCKTNIYITYIHTGCL